MRTKQHHVAFLGKDDDRGCRSPPSIEQRESNLALQHSTIGCLEPVNADRHYSELEQ